MKPKKSLSTILVTMLCLSVVARQAQAQQPGSLQSKTNRAGSAVSDSSTLLARVWRGRRPGFSLVPSNRASVTGLSSAVTSPAVHGTGTVGKISVWIDTSPNGESTLGDSIISQLNGNIGIGVATPISKLTVQGMIETTLGGYKFPDGTIQTTAAVTGLQSVSHDSTLMGDGTTGSPLGVAVPLLLSGSVESSPILTVLNNNSGFGSAVQGFMANGNGVSGLSNTVSGVIGTSSSSNGVQGHSFSSNTIVGGVNGSCNSCNGVVGRSSNLRGVLGMGPLGVYGQGDNSNTGTGGNGVKGLGGNTGFGQGGVGVEATGGFSPNQGGSGLVVIGGESVRALGGNNAGGNGIVANGGNGSTTNLEGDTRGGDGLVAVGGNATGAFFGEPFPGSGVNATGGNTDVGIGGVGVFAMGGMSRDSGGFVHAGGVGIVATGGSGNPSGRAGLFRGDVDINGSLDISGPAGGGNLSVSGTKNFKIDHPLDPENKYLLHAAIESSEVLNVYSGNIVTNSRGEAVVTLPEWFEALNRDLRYQLTVIGTFAQAIVAEKVKHNRFTIKTNAANVEVSWQVTGVRSDAMMREHPFKSEENKPERERGSYLSPELFGKPAERGVDWARLPEIMQQLKQQRTEAGPSAKQGRENL
jgi:hypothetical protein